ncbi:glycosyltransferase involved in cell wall biosynthesis [Bosea sp. BE125]|uniref:glycosyltransferase n=1 Tax=Bosea sp. BE125 TaxID=2817909 RepID=UPI002857A85F|nr:glycosyltransferase [Bosea sp. BE125]MDR6874172.1 glycosyltransferase involved in cell wall biosynthesis [Bosea sp. BE125]
MQKSVCFILDHLGVGGVQEFILNYCKFVRTRIQVTVVSIFGNDIYSERLRAAGAEVIVLTGRAYGYAAVLDPRSFQAFSTFYRKNASRFDEIHLKLFAAFAYASLMGQWRSPKVSAGLDCNRSQLPFPIQALFWIFARRYRRFYLSKLLWNDYSAFGLRRDRLRDQQYPVTRRNSKTPRIYPKGSAFLSVGRGIPQKGHAEAAALFAELQRNLSGDACLVILGEGPAIDALKATHSAAGDDAISFPGSVDDYDDWLVGATGIIRMAVGEDTNSVIREGILAGKIVATTLEGPGCRELAERGLVVAIDRKDLPASAVRLAEAVTATTPEKREQLKLAAQKLWPEEQAFAMYD